MNCPRCNANVAFSKKRCDNCGQDLKNYRRVVGLSNIYYNKGLSQAKVRDLSGAISSLKLSLQFNKLNTNARNLLGLVYLEEGEIVSALSEWVISKHYQSENNDAEDYIKMIQSNPNKLETYNQTIRKYNSALNSAKHGDDRYFLDSVVNRIVEIDKGKLYSYDCNYLGFLERKAQREEIANATERKRQSLLRTEIAWMMRGARARSTKQKAHIQRYETLRDMKSPVTDSTIEISSASSRLGKTTIELENISKSFDGIPVINDFTYFFLRNDRVGIIGPNGCGKSTLMNIITGKTKPDSGQVTIGQTVKIGYFSQENEAMDDSLRVIDYVREGGEFIHTKDGTISASVMLERFLFPPDQQYSIVGKLSGGEKRRLYLLRILMEAPNILILDEPTNDLDIATLTRLEDYLDSFDGIVITVSHDRYFLDRVVSRIFCFENSTINQYEGGYTDYLNHTTHKLDVTDAGLALSESTDNNCSENPENNSGKSKVTKDNWKDGQVKKKKMSYKEEKEFETIEADIAALEQEIEETDNAMLKAANDFVKLGELSVKKEELSQKLDYKMDRWMYLEELAADIANNS